MRRISLVLIVFILLGCGILLNVAYAISPGMEVAVLSEEEKTTLVNKADLQITQTPNSKTSIRCFDARRDGSFALGSGSGKNCMVCVYDPYGVFEYGYRFTSEGNYGILLQDDSIGIYFLRGSTILYYDHQGVCIDAQKLKSSEQSNLQIKDLLNRTVLEIGDKTYVLERDFDVGDSYSRLVVIDDYGHRTVLYDVTANHRTEQFLLAVVPISFFIAVVALCIKKQKVKEGE